MSKKEKLIKQFLSEPKDFTFEELVTLLGYFRYFPENNGKTSGSRYTFAKLNHTAITIHRPHPSNTLKSYQILQVKEILKNEGLI